LTQIKTGEKQVEISEKKNHVQKLPISDLKQDKPPINEVLVETSLFPIVGIGASAGGLEAITKLLEHLPSNSGMAFVIIQHLAPEQDSMLADILARTTKMPVHRVKNDMQVQPNNVYVIPPTVSMTISNGFLKLQKEVTRFHREVDQFLISLSQEAKNLAIGVILSGTGSDGTEGLKAIYMEGGITFAQEEDSAKYPGMPHSAIASESVHFVLPPEKIAEELTRIGKHPYLNREELKIVKPKIEELNHFQKIMALLRITFNVNFSAYKESTINRRISRRMVLHQIEKIEDYVTFLRNDKVEQQTLFDDLLIGVTSFFREPETFKQLEVEIWPNILKDKTSETPVRVWVAGCATGEEVYSLVLSLKKFMEKTGKIVPIQFFGTDINEKNIEKARAGIYNQALIENVSEQILNHFFKRVGQKYQINKSIREVCVFAKQDLTRDPPFSNMDLISCRNVLIYLKPEAQKRIIPLFHYALRPNGYLIIGKSESIGSYKELFGQIDKTPVYLRNTTVARLPLEIELSEILPRNPANEKRTVPERPIDSLQNETQRILINKFSPPSVIVNRDFDVMVFQGDTTKFLTHQSGEANLNLIGMARDELKLELQTALYLARKQAAPVKREPVRFRHDGELSKVRIEVLNVEIPQSTEKFFLILFEDLKRVDKKEQLAKGNVSQADVSGAVVKNLRNELTSTKETLQTIIEEQAATNEELRSALEEGQSSNEELQSTNEELETAKEELQSTNEELNTVNEELSTRNRELIRSQDDMSNVFNSINVAVIVLDSELKIRFFTPTSSKMFNLVDTDAGRPISDISIINIVPDFEQKLKETMKNLTPQQMQVQDNKNRWFELNLRPYLTAEKKIDGVVMSFIDIDAILQQKAEIEKSRNFSQTIVATIREPLIVIDANWRIALANPSFYKTFKIEPKKVEQLNIWDLSNHEWGIPELKQATEKVLSSGSPIQDLEIRNDFSKIGMKILKMNISRIVSVESKEKMVLITMDDVTEHAILNQKLRIHTQNLERLVQEKTNELKDSERLAAIGQTAGMVGHDIRNPLQSIVSATYLLKDEASSLPDNQQRDLILESLETIEEQSHYISKIVMDLQDFGRNLKINFEETNINSTIKNIIENSKIPSNIHINPLIEDSLPSLKTDPVYIKRILGNLITNAVQAMPDGGDLTVKAFKEKEGISINVTDTGVGIPEDVKSHIFQPLFTTKSKGQGFGLAVCKRFVEALNGEISFQSGEGKGTTFVVKLPLH
jgi:two-component system CheB/CheR fusion protein